MTDYVYVESMGTTCDIDSELGTVRGLDRVTPERIRGVYVRLDCPVTGRQDGGDMLYVEVNNTPTGPDGGWREVMSARTIDLPEFERITGIDTLRHDLGWRA